MLTFGHSFWVIYPFIAGAISQEILQEGQRLVVQTKHLVPADWSPRRPYRPIADICPFLSGRGLLLCWLMPTGTAAMPETRRRRDCDSGGAPELKGRA